MPALNRAPGEQELRKLIEIFLKAETDIVNEIGRLRSQGDIDYHAAAALERVQAILRRMENDAWEYAPKMVEKQFYARVPEARRIAGETAGKHLRGYENAAALTGEQSAAAEALVMNLMGEVTDAAMTGMATLQSALIGRIEPDVYRRVGLEQVALQQATGRGAYKMLPGFVEALRREGVTAFVDKAGRRWSLHTYCAMVSRTANRQAETLAVLTADPGQDLYQISSHASACPLCAPYEGRVYSKSGTDPDFPPLSAAFGKVDINGPDTLTNTYLNIHPGCRHVLLPWTPAGRSEEEIQKIKDFSNPEKNPFTRDPRSRKEMDAYRKREQARAKWLRDYRQWEQYRMTVGDPVPKTFATFQKHKAADDEKYRLWRLDYRRQQKLLEHPELALPGSSEAAAADAKFTQYLFGGGNQKGLAKGRAFSSRLGYNMDNWERMRDEILTAAGKYPAVLKREDIYGKRYEQQVILYGRKGKPANVLLAWNVPLDGKARLVTAYMQEA